MFSGNYPKNAGQCITSLLQIDKMLMKNENRSVKYAEQQNKLPDFKKRNPEYNQVYSKTLQGILKKLDGSYRSFFGHVKNGNVKARPPNFKGRNYLMTIPYNQSGFKIEDQYYYIFS